MNWNNIDLDSPSERYAKILEPYSFDALLLELSCNLKEVNKETIKKQFLESLESKIQCAKDVFEANLNNIVSKATEERNEN